MTLASSLPLKTLSHKVPYGGELQIWLHKQVIAFDILGVHHVELSLALLVPPHGWIDGLLDVDGLFVTTLAVTQFSKVSARAHAAS